MKPTHSVQTGPASRTIFYAGSQSSTTQIHWKVLFLFFGSMVAFIAGVGIWDGYLARNLPSGSTISWQMSLLGRQYPLFVFWIGFGTDFVISNLVGHWWPTLPSVDAWEETERLKQQVKDLTFENDDLKLEIVQWWANPLAQLKHGTPPRAI